MFCGDAVGEARAWTRLEAAAKALCLARGWVNRIRRLHLHVIEPCNVGRHRPRRLLPFRINPCVHQRCSHPV